MTAQHTPGPWFIWKELAMQREGCAPDEISDELLYDHEHGIYAGNPDQCTRGLLRGHKAHICDIDADSTDFDDDEHQGRSVALANARLIAAAPEMLKALKVVVKDWTEQFEKRGHMAPLWCQQARDAIAKAEGGAA